MLELYELKNSRTVLRRGEWSNPFSLFDKADFSKNSAINYNMIPALAV